MPGKRNAVSFIKTVLTIAGFDPSSGAGVTADLMVFAAHVLFGVSCITALTVQSTTGVVATHSVAAEVVRATLSCLQADLPAAGVKIGMLGTASNVEAVADFLTMVRGLDGDGKRTPVVLDPVLRSSSGRELLDAGGVRLIRERLLPYPRLRFRTPGCLRPVTWQPPRGPTPPWPHRWQRRTLR